MASLGNTGVSSLVSSAVSASKQIDALNVQNAQYTYDDSAKTAEDYQKYVSTVKPLADRYAGSASISNQKLASSYNQKLVTAANSYDTAQIDRASISIDQGTMSATDKVNLLGQLVQHSNDPAQQQRLLLQYDSAVKTLDNQNTAATTTAYNNEIKKLDDGITQLKSAALGGQITPAQFDTRMNQMYMGNAKTGAPGILSVINGAIQATGDPNLSYQTKLDQIGADSTAQKYISGTNAAENALGEPNQMVTRDANGNYHFVDRTGQDILGMQPVHNSDGTLALDANGHAIIGYKYASPQASTYSATEAKPNGAQTGSVKTFEYATNVDSNGNFAPGTGPGEIRQVGAEQIQHNDPSGVPYFYNDQGQKKYVGVDATNGHSIMASNPNVIQGNVPGVTTPAQTVKKVATAAGKELAPPSGPQFANMAIITPKTFDPLGRLTGEAVGAVKNALGGAANDVQNFINGITQNKASQVKTNATAAKVSTAPTIKPAKVSTTQPSPTPNLAAVPKITPVNKAPQPAPKPAGNPLQGVENFGTSVFNAGKQALGAAGNFIGKLF